MKTIGFALFLCLVTSFSAHAGSTARAYVANEDSDSVSVIDLSTNGVIATIPGIGDGPFGVAVHPDGSEVYVTNRLDGTNSLARIDTSDNSVSYFTNLTGAGLSHIAVDVPNNQLIVTGPALYKVPLDGVSAVTAIASGGSSDLVLFGGKSYAVLQGGSFLIVTDLTTNTIDAFPNVGSIPIGAAMYGGNVYVANQGSDTISVVSIASNTVIDTIAVGDGPTDIAISSSGLLYVSNSIDNTVSIVDLTAMTPAVGSTISVQTEPWGLSLSDNEDRLFVANKGANTVSIIDTATNMVLASPAVQTGPSSMGDFIGPGQTPVDLQSFEID